MQIKFSKETKQRLTASIKRYFAQNAEEEIGDLKASLFLDYCLKEIGPSIYNQAIADAQAFIQEKVADLDSSLFLREFAYWDD